jgi:carbon-monoxide dehydrogenase iron sulfur subunit
MKKLTVKKGAKCMACLECVRACSVAFYKEFHQDKACIKIVERNGAVRPLTCVQCGKCAQVCEAHAITQNAKGVYMINKKLCVQCGKCKDACPFGVLVKVDESPASKCIACGLCAKNCPMQILEIVEQ